MPYELCLPFDTMDSDLQMNPQNSLKYKDSCLNTFHHHQRMLQYSTLQSPTNHLNHLTQSTHQLNCVCDVAENCNMNSNCDQMLPHPFMDSGEITLESTFDGNIGTLNRRTIPISILLPPNNSSNQTNLIAPLACGHLLATNQQQNSTICNSIDQSSTASVDQTTTTNSLEQQNSNTNRVFFIRTSNADLTNKDLMQTNALIRQSQLNLNNKVQITDSGYNEKKNQELDQMLYLNQAMNQSNTNDQFDYYKILNRTPIFDDSYVTDLNYNGLELLANPYLHEQVINLNNNDQINNKTHLDQFDKELSNVEIMDGNSIESNQPVSLNNKTVSLMRKKINRYLI